VTAAELRRRVKVQKVKSESVSASRVKTEVKDEKAAGDLDDLVAELKQEVDRSVKKEKVLRKRTRKQVKMARCDFLDFEAEESGGDCEEEIVKTEADLKRGKFWFGFFRVWPILNFVETYTKKELQRKTEAVSDVVKRLEEKYKLEEG